MSSVPEYEEARAKAQELYSGTKPLYCPALGEKVHFTAEGFNHILFGKKKSERDPSQQLARFSLLERAVRLIGLSTTYQEFEETSKEIEVKWKKKRMLRDVPILYWGLIAIVQNRKIRVVLRKVGTGNIHFWSVIPGWITTKRRDIKFMTTMQGNPEED
ncbi:MAG: hypothetical protein JWL88_136 [Parcubacteria group bacterium]|nr:hypothetical protein [Parcubacteria group bacterium]